MGNGYAKYSGLGGGGGGTSLTFIDSIVNTGGNVSLVNDSASPGNSKYYGTNSGGTLGYFSLPTVTAGNLTDVGTDGITIGNGTGAVLGSGTTISQHVADTTHNGYLASVDWNTFNGKQAALTFGNLTDAGTDGITIGSGTGAVIGSGTTISQHVADTSHNGYLSSTDWNTFNTSASGSVTTMGAFGSTPNNNAGSISGNTLTLQPADGTHPGGMSTTTQTIAGNKTWSGTMSCPSSGTTTEVWGASAVGTGTNTTVLGNAATGSTASQCVVIGTSASSGANNDNVVVGYSASAASTQNVVVGRSSTAGSGSASVVVGYASTAGTAGIGIGWQTTAQKESVVIGAGAAANDSVTGQNIVIGRSSTISSGATQNLLMGYSCSITSGSNQAVFGSTSGPLNNIYFGQGITTASASTTTMQVSGGSGTNNAAGNWALAGGKSTGTATPGALLFQTSTATTTGSTVQTLSTRAKILDAIQIAQTATPANPASGFDSLYFKSDDKLYGLSSGGTEVLLGPEVTFPIAINKGGTGQITAAAAFNALSPITTTGDIIYSPSGATSQRLGIGSTGNVLTVSGGVPAWAPPSGGGTINYFSGFTANATEWSTTSATFADPTISGSDTLTTRVSSGLTVTKAASSLPGITLTPPSNTAAYEVTAAFSMNTNNNTGILSAQLYDGTNVITTASGQTFFEFSVDGDIPFKLSGIWVPGTTSASTIKIQIAGTASTYIQPAGTLAASIEWTVKQISS